MAFLRGDSAPDDAERMRHITAPFKTKADKIRALGRAGFSRARIAEFLGIRYQHVRNVLEHERKRERPTLGGGAALERSGRAEITETGHVVIPPEVLEHLQLRPGGVVPWRLEDNELVLMGLTAAVRRSQAIAEKYPLPAGKTLTDLLFEERRAEAGREEEEDRGNG